MTVLPAAKVQEVIQKRQKKNLKNVKIKKKFEVAWA